MYTGDGLRVPPVRLCARDEVSNKCTRCFPSRDCSFDTCQDVCHDMCHEVCRDVSRLITPCREKRCVDKAEQRCRCSWCYLRVFYVLYALCAFNVFYFVLFVIHVFEWHLFF